MILVPVKNLSTAKQRLAAVLDQSARTALAQAMLHDVVVAIASSQCGIERSLVTSDPFACDLAREYDFDVIPDLANPGETGAIEMATVHCFGKGVDSTLVFPADIPLIQPGEVDEIFSQAPKEGSLLVPASDGRGTNAIFRRPANLFPLSFGNDSFRPHLAAAQASGKPWRVLQLPGIGLDVDNPADLQQLMERPGKSRAQDLLRHWAIDVRRLETTTERP